MHREAPRFRLEYFFYGARRFFFLLVILFFALTVLLWIYRQFEHPALANMRPQSTAIYASNGALMRLGLASDDRYRLWLLREEIPGQLIEAVKLKEDRWFEWHPGVNPVSLLRGAVLSYSKTNYRAGGSTLTMQLVRLRDRSFTRSISGKFRQAVDAVIMSARYPKREVLSAYLNYAPYGGNIEGVGAASLIYFNKPAMSLNLPEILTLAVLPQRPQLNCPINIQQNLNAQDCLSVELRQARLRLFSKWIQQHPEDARWQSLIEAPVAMRHPSQLPFLAPHASAHLLADARARGHLPRRIQSTIEPRLQNIIQRQIDRYLARQKLIGVNNASAVLLDTRDMSVKAMIGSRDFYDAKIHGQVNGVFAKRSPGSTLKPFLYALAIDQGQLHPGTILRDVPTAFGSFTPENFDGRFVGPVSATQALIRSRNIPAVNVAARLSKPNLHQFLKSAGVNKLASESHYGLALVLGGGEVSMLELARMYAMLSNDGVLRSVRHRTDDPNENGAILLSAEASFIVRDMLQQNPRPDSGKSRLPVAWKTGTSWGFHDAWTAGIYGPYVLVVWLGNFDNTPNPALVGIQTAAPLFFTLLDAIDSDDSTLREPLRRWPLNLTRVNVCTASGDLPNAYCPDVSETWFIPGKSPIKISTLHRPVIFDARSGKVVCEVDPTRVTRAQIYEFWPSDLAEVFRQAGLPRATPPSAANCKLGFETAGSKPQIISPRRSAVYLLSINASAKPDSESTQKPMGDHEKIILHATIDAEVRNLYWFVDSSLIAVGRRDEKIEWRPRTAGRYLIRASDDKGRSDERWVEVGMRN